MVTLTIDNRDWETDDLPIEADAYRVNPETYRLERAVSHQQKLPEDQWPGHPGFAWWGVLGTTKTIVDDWVPMDLTGALDISTFVKERGLLLGASVQLDHGKVTRMRSRA